MMKVLRWTPMYFLPYIDFSTHWPYFSAILWSGSPISVNGSLYFFLNFASLSGCVRRDADDHRAGLLVFLEAIADPAGLRRATGRVGLGVEVEDERLALEVVELDGLAVLVLAA